jgi:hypothetical protein
VLERSMELEPDADPSPAIVRQLRWRDGDTSPRRPVLELELRNLRAATVDLAGAGFARREAGSVELTLDGPTELTLTRLRPGSRVVSATGGTWRVNGHGTVTITFAGGADRLSLSR